MDGTDSVLEHLPAVRAFLSQRGVPAAERDDVMADVTEVAPGLVGRVRNPDRLRSFFVGVAANFLRRRQRRAALEREHVEASVSAEQWAEDAETILERKQEIEAVLSGIAQLPKAQREALLLTAVEGLSTREGARLEKVSEGTFRSRLFHARKSLEATLGRKAPSKRVRVSVVLFVLAMSMMAFGAVRLLTRAVPVEAPKPQMPVKYGPAKKVEAMVEPELEVVAAAVAPVLMVVPKPRVTRAALTPPPLVVTEAEVQVAPVAVDSNALYRAALALHLSRRDDAAIEAWSRFLAETPRGPLTLEARFRRAQAWVRSGRSGLAREELEALMQQTEQPGIAADAAVLIR